MYLLSCLYTSDRRGITYSLHKQKSNISYTGLDEKDRYQNLKTANQQLEGLKDSMDQNAEQAKENIDQGVETSKKALEKSEEKIDTNAQLAKEKVEQINENVEKKLDEIKDVTPSKSETTGEYIDDSIITAKVKAAIMGSSWLSESHIEVTTDKGIVKLSGTVDTEQSIAKAIEVASGQEHVKAVQSDLVVTVTASSKK